MARFLQRWLLCVLGLSLGACDIDPLSSHLDQGTPDGRLDGDGGVGDADANTSADGTPDGAPDTGWTLVYSDPLASPQTALHDIWVNNASHVVAVGDGGRIVQFDGKDWKARPHVWTTTLYGVWGSSPSDMVAAGIDDQQMAPRVEYFDGSSWTAETSFPAGTYPLTDVWGVGTMLFFSSWAGKVYQHDPLTFPSQPYKNTLNTGGCPAITDPPPTLQGISAMSVEDALVVGESGLMAHRTAAKGWVRICNTDPTANYAGVFHLPGTAHYYMGSNYLGLELYRTEVPDMYRVHEDRKVPNAQKLYIRAIWGTVQDGLLAVGDQGTVLYTQANTTNVKKVPFPTQETLHGVMGVDSETVYVCGQGAKIWRGKLPD